MAAGRLIIPQYMPAEDANGDRIAGARLYFYDFDTEATTDLKPIYTTSALSVQHANPVVADASGIFAAIWADTTEEFTVVVADADGAPIVTYDGVSPSIDATLASVALADAAAEAAEAAQAGAEDALAQAEALLAETTGEPFTATSSSSLSITTGAKTVLLNEAGKLYSPGQAINVARPSPNGANRLVGVIDGVTEDGAGVQTLAMTATIASAPGGTGPYTSWVVSLASDTGVLSIAGEAGVVTAAEAKAALAITSDDVTDFDAAVNNLAIAAAVAL